MSNPIRYDPLLVSYLADELHARCGGRACDGLPRWDSLGAVTLQLDSGEALRLDLHPARGWIRVVPLPDRSARLDWRISRISTPHDERLLQFEMESGNRFRALHRRWIVELQTNQWNSILVDETENRIVSVFRPRVAGTRRLEVGEAYQPPPQQLRIDPRTHTPEEAWSAWERSIVAIAPNERTRSLIRSFANTGTLNAGWILNPLTADIPIGDRKAFDRWWRLAVRRTPEPVLLELDPGLQPYPWPLEGVPSRRVLSLLSAMEESAAAAEVERALPAEIHSLLPELHRRRAAAERRIARLSEQLRDSLSGDQARARGDLLLANLAAVRNGAESVTLPDWDGRETQVPLDPTLSPAENAARWYDIARRQRRAAERLPPMIRSAEEERDRWAALLLSAHETGELPDAVRRELGVSRPGAGEPSRREGSRDPYRLFTTSGGLEVRVGRGSKENDRLTFGHSSPNDVWLHARSVSGSHVILRWPDATQQPPKRDLTEAAGLAAWFSKARTSGLVAVDWTRRKHVRKPRGAPPGSVVPSRVKTLFVRPDPQLAERLGATEEWLSGASKTSDSGGEATLAEPRPST